MCEFCGTKIRSNATKCYVRGCVGYGLDITEMSNFSIDVTTSGVEISVSPRYAL